jgi:hypothetical protein
MNFTSRVYSFDSTFDVSFEVKINIVKHSHRKIETEKIKENWEVRASCKIAAESVKELLQANCCKQQQYGKLKTSWAAKEQRSSLGFKELNSLSSCCCSAVAQAQGVQ